MPFPACMNFVFLLMSSGYSVLSFVHCAVRSISISMYCTLYMYCTSRVHCFLALCDDLGQFLVLQGGASVMVNPAIDARLST